MDFDSIFIPKEARNQLLINIISTTFKHTIKIEQRKFKQAIEINKSLAEVTDTKSFIVSH